MFPFTIVMIVAINIILMWEVFGCDGAAEQNPETCHVSNDQPVVSLFWKSEQDIVVSQPLFMPLFWSRVIIGSVGDSPKGQRSREG